MNFENKKHLDYDSPLSHDVMMEHINALSEHYPFLSVTSLGASILGRSIPIITLGVGDSSLLYVGAHHGTDWLTSIALLRFVGEYSELYEKKRSIFSFDIGYLYSHRSIHVVPMLNPDGVDYQINGVEKDNLLYDRVMKMNGNSENFSKWKANARGVDLAHNYNFGFTEYKKRELEEGISVGAPRGFSGNMPESEPEVASLCNYLRFNDNIKGILTLDTQGNEIYCFEGTNDTRSSRLGVALSRISGYKQTKVNGNGLTDWCASVLGRTAFTLKCGTGEEPLPIFDNFKIYADIRELLFSFPTMIS